MPLLIFERYAVPLVALSALTGGFFLTGRFQPLRPRLAPPLRVVAAVPLLVSGTFHLLRPGMFVPALPPVFPPSPALIVATGVPELLGALGLFLPPTRRTASLCLAIYMVGIFPANVYIAGRTIGGISMPGVPVRAAMQAAYIVLLLIAGWGVPARRS